MMAALERSKDLFSGIAAALKRSKDLAGYCDLQPSRGLAPLTVLWQP